jgi:hypothetical protein
VRGGQGPFSCCTQGPARLHRPQTPRQRKDSTTAANAPVPRRPSPELPHPHGLPHAREPPLSIAHPTVNGLQLLSPSPLHVSSVAARCIR